MVSAEFEGTCTMMQSAAATAAGDPLSPEASYLRGMAAAGYPHPDSVLPHPHHPHMQVSSHLVHPDNAIGSVQHPNNYVFHFKIEKLTKTKKTR